MTDDPFESDLQVLFADTPAFRDAEAFAQAVERRLEPEAAPARPSPARWGLIGAAGLVGGGLALKSLQLLLVRGTPALDQAQGAVAQWSLSLSDALADVSTGLAGSQLWMLVGLGAAIAAGFALLQEI